MKKIVSMVLFAGVVLLSPKIMSNVSDAIAVKNPTYKAEKQIDKPIEYYIIERDVSSEILYVEPETSTQKEPNHINISPIVSVKNTDKITEKNARYMPTVNERKLMAALAWREDHTSVESMMAVIEVVLNRLESDIYCFSKLKDVEDVIFQASWIRGKYVEQYVNAKLLYEIDPTDESFEAVDRVCAGEIVIGKDALFHAEKSVPSWRIANDIYIVQIIEETKFWAIKE